MKKKLWTLALAFCLVSAMLPGGVFHAERAWATAATSVKIGGVEMVDGDSTTYYKNDEGKVNVETTGYNAKYEPGAGGQAGTLTLNGLNLTVNGYTDGISANGDLVIELEESSKIETQGTNIAIYARSGNLTISGTGTLEAKNENTGSENSLIYAQGNIVINGGAQVIATTKSRAQAINANAGNMEIAGENTSVKAISHGSAANSDAIRANAGRDSVGEGTVTVTGGATLEAETTSLNAKAINGKVIATGSKIKAGDSKAAATAWTDGSAPALNTYKYVRIGEEEPNYLTFTAEVDNSSVTLNYKSGTEVQYKQYTKTSNTWGEWTTYTAGTAIPLAKDEQVSFKGKDVTTDFSNHFTMTGKIAASGSVTSLTDEKGNDSNVQLQNGCYKYMFYNCTSLTTAPKLPAKSLAESCYEEMFRSCTSLTTAPDLTATEAKKSCYKNMFYDCKKLTKAPDVLPATTLADNCYDLMFYNCSALQAAPELSAGTLADYCYYGMFTGCSALKEVPTLPATILAKGCYQQMFWGCKGLTTVPTLPATTLADNCYDEMFKDCKNLSINNKQDTNHTQAWKIEAAEPTTANGWNTNMFAGCTNVDFGSGSKAPQLNTTYYVNPAGANSGGTTQTGTKITKPRLAQNTFPYKGTNITPTLQFTNPNDKEHVTISGGTSKKDVGNYTIRVTPKTGYTWADNSRATLSFSWNITQAGNIYVKVENLTAYVDDTTLPQHKYTITGLLGEDQNQASVTFTYHRIIDATGNAERNESVPDLTREGKYRIDVSRLTIAKADYTQNYTSLNYTAGELEIVKKASTPSGSSGGGYVAPSTDVKTSGSADSKVTSSPSTVQNETRTDASGKQETVAKVTVSAANQREILSQAKANKSKHIIIQIAKTAVQGDAKLELNLDKPFVQSILHDTEASLTIRTADGDKVIAREALKTLLAQTEGNTVVIDPAAQENPTDPAEPSKAETLAALDSSRLVARSKLVTLKNGRKGIRITWSDKNGAEMNFDGMEIYRSTKKNRFGKKPFYATKGGKSAGYYINSKSLKSGVTYYYKVRGYVLIDGQKHYTDLSLKAIRTVK